MRHELKTWPAFYQAILSNQKRYEIRKNDRDFQVGDELFLREYEPKTQTYTGREMTVIVTYMTKGGQWGIPEGICVMGIKVEHWNLGDQSSP